MSWKEEEESNSYSCFVQPKGETESFKESKGTGTHEMFWIAFYLITSLQPSLLQMYMSIIILLQDQVVQSYMLCCRDGKKKDHNGPSKTGKKRKHTVSRKVEGYCMERMIAVEQFSIRLNSCTISQETLVFSSLKAMWIISQTCYQQKSVTQVKYSPYQKLVSISV